MSIREQGIIIRNCEKKVELYEQKLSKAKTELKEAKEVLRQLEQTQNYFVTDHYNTESYLLVIKSRYSITL